MYGQFLINTPTNVTGTYFADTSGQQFAHDQVTRFLGRSKLTPRIIRDKALADIPLSSHGFVLFVDIPGNCALEIPLSVGAVSLNSTAVYAPDFITGRNPLENGPLQVSVFAALSKEQHQRLAYELERLGRRVIGF